MRRIAVIGLGYVGLAVARACARRFPGTLGFDRDAERVDELRAGRDPTGALAEAGALGTLALTSDARALGSADFFVIAVPTPIDGAHRPELSALAEAASTVGRALRPGAVVVLESTVHPGLTEEWLGPRLEAASGLVRGRDFTLGYSPERINPGDPAHAFERVRKVIAAEDAATLDVLESVYGAVVEAGVFRAPSIRVAETAKVLENVQRDLNVALVNELARICHAQGIDTGEVLATAGTKWNFLPFRPGLVGGHCIGVDPYYLAARAEALGVEPRVILAGRAVNDGMRAFVADEILARLATRPGGARGARLGVLGIAFKPDVADLRNSGVPAVLERLAAAGVELVVHDPRVERGLAARHHGLELAPATALRALDAVLLAVPHRGLAELALSCLDERTRFLFDLSGALERARVPAGVALWRL
jgi:UDP-N-acetyl-D-glucosamine/UDP-N-acetyl-D-galactosamine dehydrogenase